VTVCDGGADVGVLHAIRRCVVCRINGGFFQWLLAMDGKQSLRSHTR
jgi:hypothetical protein